MQSVFGGWLEGVWRWQVLERILRRRVAVTPCPGLMPVAGWGLPVQLLNGHSICYCGGVGRDITLELMLAYHYGCQVFAFDPTYYAVSHVASQPQLPSNFRFIQEGLWNTDQEMTFSRPKSFEKVADFAIDTEARHNAGLQQFKAQVSCISTLMSRFGHAKLDLLKMNIEGAEEQVLNRMLADGIHPTILAFAVEGPRSYRRIFEWQKRLRKEGYVLINYHWWTLTFVLQSVLTAKQSAGVPGV